jgi:hypothetical protein
MTDFSCSKTKILDVAHVDVFGVMSKEAVDMFPPVMATDKMRNEALRVDYVLLLPCKPSSWKARLPQEVAYSLRCFESPTPKLVGWKSVDSRWLALVERCALEWN